MLLLIYVLFNICVYTYIYIYIYVYVHTRAIEASVDALMELATPGDDVAVSKLAMRLADEDHMNIYVYIYIYIYTHIYTCA